MVTIKRNRDNRHRHSTYSIYLFREFWLFMVAKVAQNATKYNFLAIFSMYDVRAPIRTLYVPYTYLIRTFYFRESTCLQIRAG